MVSLGRIYLAAAYDPEGDYYAAALDELRGAARGTRDDTLFESSRRLGRLVAVKYCAEETARGDLEALARLIGLEPSKSRGTVTRGLKAGMANPWTDEPPAKSSSARPTLTVVSTQDTAEEDEEAAGKTDRARRLYEAAGPLEGTRGAAYVAGRGIASPPATVRYSGAFNGILFPLTTPAGEVVAVQKVYLDQDGNRTADKETNGAMRDAVFVVGATKEGAPTIIVDGPEDAMLAAAITGCRALATAGKARFRHAAAHVQRGDRVVLIADRDGTDLSEYNAAQEAFLRRGALVTLVETPDRPLTGDLEEPKDITDLWRAGGPKAVAELIERAAGTLEYGQDDDLFTESEVCDEPPRTDPQPTRTADTLIDPTALEGVEPKPREWLVADWIPSRAVTLLSGDGGTGKSLAALQLATAVATGNPWLGLEVTEAPVLVISCEDEADELHRRQADICGATGIGFGELGRLRWWDRVGKDNILWGGDGDVSKDSLTAEAIIREARGIGARLIVIDGAADVFGGNENARSEVKAFLAELTRVALAINGAVVLIAHTSKAAGADGRATFSGSTAWNNSVRSRLMFERDQGGEVRVLSKPKSNYAAAGDAVRLIWRDGVFVPEAMMGKDEVERISENVLQLRAKEVFLNALDELTAQRRALSHNSRAGNYAPKVIATTKAGKAFKWPALRDAMESLFAEGVIVAGVELWKGADRKPVCGVSRIVKG